MLRAVKERSRQDAAAATLVMGVISMMFIILALGFAVDLTKNAYVKNAQNSKAQESVQAAVKTVDSRGSLANFTRDSSGEVPDAVYKVVEEYNNTNSSNYNNALVGSGKHYDETTAYKGKACAVRDIYKWGSAAKSPATMPYMVIKLDRERGFDNSADSVVYTVEGSGKPVHVSGAFKAGAPYRVVSAEIQDSSVNFLLGIFGMPCQGYDSKVSAISFGSQQDLAQN